MPRTQIRFLVGPLRPLDLGPEFVGRAWLRRIQAPADQILGILSGAGEAEVLERQTVMAP
jgi:hypothetical protein